MTFLAKIWRFAKYPLLIGFGIVLGGQLPTLYLLYDLNRDYNRAAELPFATDITQKPPSFARENSMLPFNLSQDDLQSRFDALLPCLEAPLEALSAGQVGIEGCRNVVDGLDMTVNWQRQLGQPDIYASSGGLWRTETIVGLGLLTGGGLLDGPLPPVYRLTGLGQNLWEMETFRKGASQAMGQSSLEKEYLWNVAGIVKPLGLPENPEDAVKRVACTTDTCVMEYIFDYCTENGVSQGRLRVSMSSLQGDDRAPMHHLFDNVIAAHGLAVAFKAQAMERTCERRAN
jgi:hypothetical protein